MHEAEPRAALISKERALLRQLCRTGVTGGARDIVEVLSQYCWEGPDHRIVFEALVRLSGVPPSSLGERLPAETTRMGFPEIHWEEFLAPVPGGLDRSSTLRELIEELVSRSKQGS